MQAELRPGPCAASETPSQVMVSGAGKSVLPPGILGWVTQAG